MRKRIMCIFLSLIMIISGLFISQPAEVKASEGEQWLPGFQVTSDNQTAQFLFSADSGSFESTYHAIVHPICVVDTSMKEALVTIPIEEGTELVCGDSTGSTYGSLQVVSGSAVTPVVLPSEPEHAVEFVQTASGAAITANKTQITVKRDDDSLLISLSATEALRDKLRLHIRKEGISQYYEIEFRTRTEDELPNLTASGFCGKDSDKKKVIWEFYGDLGLIVIRGNGVMMDDANYSAYNQYFNQVKEVIVKKGVTEIGDFAFYWCTSLEKLSLPEGLETIGEYAFVNTRITSVTLPESVTTIENYAFCNSLIFSVQIPKGVTELGCNAFNNYWMREISFEEGNTSYLIEDSFIYSYDKKSIIYGVGSLEGTVTIPEGVEKLGGHAFSVCSSIKKLILPKSIKEIENIVGTGISVFEVHPENPYFDGFEDCLYSEGLKDLLFVPDAYKGTLTIAEGVQKINEGVLGSCDEITELVLPASISDFSAKSTRYCYGFLKFSVNPQNTTFCSINGLLYSKDVKKLIAVPNGLGGKLVIPEGVEMVCTNAFEGADKLAEVYLPASLKTIQNDAFVNNSKLEQVFINSSEVQFDSTSFFRSSNLKKIVMNGKVKSSITKFYELHPDITLFCKNDKVEEPLSITETNILYNEEWNLISFKRGDNVIKAITITGEEILTKPMLSTFDMEKNGKFYKAVGFDINGDKVGDSLPSTIQSDLEVDVLYNTGTVIDWTVRGDFDEDIHWLFNETTGVLTIYGSGSIKAQALSKFSNQYRNDVKEIRIETGITELPNNAFADYENLTNVLLPEGLLRIGMYAFERTELTEVILPESLEEISDLAFAGCMMLEKINIPKNVTQIGMNVFMATPLLTEFLIDEANQSYQYADGIVYNKNKTEAIFGLPRMLSGNVILPEGIKRLNGDIFDECKDVSSVWIPKSVESISFTNRVSTINNQLTYQVDCRNLYYTAINGNLYSKDMKALLIVSGMTTGIFVMPNSVERLSEDAFSRCPNINEIHLSTNVTEIQSMSFRGCDSLKRIVVPSNNKSLYSYDGVLYSKDKKTVLYVPCGMQGNLIIPEGTEILGERATDECDKLTTITLPSSLHTIGRYNFNNTSLKKIVLLGKVTTFERPYFTEYKIDKNIILCNSTEAETEDWLIRYLSDETDIYFEGEWYAAEFINEGKVIASSGYLPNETIVIPKVNKLPTPQSDNYSYQFIGWDINSDGETDTLPTSLTENLRAVAVYQPIYQPSYGSYTSFSSTTDVKVDNKTGHITTIKEEKKVDEGNGTVVIIETEVVKDKEGKVVSESMKVKVELSADTMVNQRKDFVKEVLEAVAGADVCLVIDIKNEDNTTAYTWKFEGTGVNAAEEIGSIDLSVTVRAADKKENAEMVDELIKNAVPKDSVAIVISFGHSGKLPETATVKVNVKGIEGLKPGDKVILYYFNPTAGKLEALPDNIYVVDEEYFVSLILNNCSDYVLLTKEPLPDALYSPNVLFVTTKRDLVVGEQFEFEIDAVDYDISTLRWLTTKRGIAVVGKNKGKLSATITAKNVGTERVKIEIQRSNGEWDQYYYTIKVSENKKTNYYIVKKGDTLLKIAREFGCKLSDLVGWNNINNPDIINIGQKLIITK